MERTWDKFRVVKLDLSKEEHNGLVVTLQAVLSDSDFEVKKWKSLLNELVDVSASGAK